MHNSDRLKRSSST